MAIGYSRSDVVTHTRLYKRICGSDKRFNFNECERYHVQPLVSTNWTRMHWSYFIQFFLF